MLTISKTAREVGENGKRKGCLTSPLSFHIVFEVLITGVKGHNSSESHFAILNVLQKVVC